MPAHSVLWDTPITPDRARMPSTIYIQYIQEFEFQHLHVQWTPLNRDSDKGDFLLNRTFLW